jgi:hypothetical protein
MLSFNPRWMMDPDFERNGYDYKQKFIYTGDDHDDNHEDDDKYFNNLIYKYKKIHIYISDDNEADIDEINLYNSINDTYDDNNEYLYINIYKY